MRDKLSWKKSALVTFEIFRLFVNTLTPDDKYSRRKYRFSDSNFKRLYLKKKKEFVDFWLHFWKVHEIYNILKGKKSILS